jgi:hypothetical protein
VKVGLVKRVVSHPHKKTVVCSCLGTMVSPPFSCLFPAGTCSWKDLQIEIVADNARKPEYSATAELYKRKRNLLQRRTPVRLKSFDSNPVMPKRPPADECLEAPRNTTGQADEATNGSVSKLETSEARAKKRRSVATVSVTPLVNSCAPDSSQPKPRCRWDSVSPARKSDATPRHCMKSCETSPSSVLSLQSAIHSGRMHQLATPSHKASPASNLLASPLTRPVSEQVSFSLHPPVRRNSIDTGEQDGVSCVTSTHANFGRNKNLSNDTREPLLDTVSLIGQALDELGLNDDQIAQFRCRQRPGAIVPCPRSASA